MVRTLTVGLVAHRALAAMVMSLALGACAASPASGGASIVLTEVPPSGEGGSERVAPIAGRVTGAGGDAQVVLYARSGIWWVQPLVAKPFTQIGRNSTWRNTTHLGTEYAALLVEPGFQPPPTIETLPPVGGHVLAITIRKGTGTYVPPPRRLLTFSGYEWEVRQSPSDRGGANDYDARNAWVDRDGLLHLLLTSREGRWTSAEVKLTRSLGYGTYAFTVRDMSRLDPAAALGLLTWDELGRDQNYRELDVEISRWGDPENKDVQYVVQPQYVAANVHRFVQPAGRLVHSFRWEPGRASFRTVRPSGSIVANRDFTSGIPASGMETVRMNLLYYRSAARPPAGDVEVVIEKFEYLP
jgi:hypothetical protein